VGVDKGLEGLAVELGDGAVGQLLPCGCEPGKQLLSAVAELDDCDPPVGGEGWRTTSPAASSLRTLLVMVGGPRPLA